MRHKAAFYIQVRPFDVRAALSTLRLISSLLTAKEAVTTAGFLSSLRPRRCLSAAEQVFAHGSAEIRRFTGTGVCIAVQCPQNNSEFLFNCSHV